MKIFDTGPELFEIAGLSKPDSEPKDPVAFRTIMNALENIVLAHKTEGIDVQDGPYARGLKIALAEVLTL